MSAQWIATPPIDSAAFGVLRRELSDPEQLSFLDPEVQTSSFDKLARSWPGMSETMRAVSRSVSRAGFAILGGFPFDESGRLLTSASSSLGTILQPYRFPGARVVKNIVPNDGTAEAVMSPHTDSVDWPEPNTMTVLECVRDDPGGGGYTGLVSTSELAKNLGRRMAMDTLKTLTSVPVRYEIGEAFGGGELWSPILRKGRPGQPYGARYLNVSVTKFISESPKERQSLASAAKAMEEAALQSPSAVSVRLKPGEVLFTHNVTTLHWRSTVDPSSPRMLRRLKMNFRE